MSEQEPESIPYYEQVETQDTLPDEHSSGQEAADEMEEAQEAEDAEAAQVEAVPAEPEGLSEKQLEARLKRLDKSSATWRERVATIMEADAAMLIPCPLCEQIIPGFVMPTPATPERFPAVREFMGDAQPQEWEQDPNTHTCQTCNGMGEVKTGSKVQSQATLVCTDCGGKGWQGQRAPIVTSGPLAVQPLPDANGQSEVTPQGPEPPEAAKLRAMGYTLIQPVGAS